MCVLCKVWRKLVSLLELRNAKSEKNTKPIHNRTHTVSKEKGEAAPEMRNTKNEKSPKTMNIVGRETAEAAHEKRSAKKTTGEIISRRGREKRRPTPKCETRKASPAVWLCSAFFFITTNPPPCFEWYAHSPARFFSIATRAILAKLRTSYVAQLFCKGKQKGRRPIRGGPGPEGVFACSVSILSRGMLPARAPATDRRGPRPRGAAPSSAEPV